jgi:F-type H+-transporting ATPase subunit epsilon
MANELNLEIITPKTVKYKGEVKSVTVPGTMGKFQVLKNHAPIISTLDVGELKVEKLNNQNLYFATSGGTIEVLKNNILLLLDSVEAIEEIDIEQARKTKETAETVLNESTDTTALEEAEMALKRAINRLNLVEKHLRAD